jgi:YegS/Rv2252/BmrU family lipid kinase
MRALVVGRRRKGRPIRQAVRETAGALEAAGWTVESSVVRKKRELRHEAAQAVEAEVDIVVAVGGDGAVLQVVQAIAEKPVALGIVPLGTGNLVARNLGIPKGVEAGVKTLLEGRPRTIDLGLVTLGGEQWFFTVACGVGFDAEVMKATKAREKDRWGKLAYLANAITESGKVHNVEHLISLDGVETSMEAAQLFVANFARTGLGTEPRLEVKPDDGILDVIAIDAAGPLSGLVAGLRALRQGHFGKGAGGKALRAQAREILVTTPKRRHVEVDGSVVGKTPIAVEVRPRALTAIVPPPTA